MMNSKDYRKAMECLEPDPFLRARLAAAVENARPVRSRPMRQVFTVALAAALALACTMAAALAVSPELRSSVISLFQMDVVEQVPGIPEGVSGVKQVDIGEGVTAQYVRVEGFWSVANGLLQDGKYREDTDSRLWHYYDLIDGQLVEVGTDAREAAVQLTWNGVERSARFRWFVYNGTLHYTEETEMRMSGESDLALVIQVIGNRTDKLMLTAADVGLRRDTWSWVYDLETGDVTDVLAGCGLENIGPIRRLRMSEDLKHALAWVGYLEESAPYLVDLEAKTCTSLRDVFGMELREGQFPDENGEAVEIEFSDDDTVLLIRFRDQFMETERLPHINGAWTYHIPSGMVTQTVSENERPLVMTPLTLSLTGSGEVTVVDLRTGSHTRLEGVAAYEEHCEDFRCHADPTGARLLWADMDGDRVARMGIVDLEEGTFRAFERDDQSGQEELKFEYMYWLYDGRVASLRDLGWDPETKDYPCQICVYDF